MTEQESHDIKKARMLVSSRDALMGPKKELVTRICDGFVKKCAQLTCIREKAEALMGLVDSEIQRRVCYRDGNCRKPSCPQGYPCLECHMKDAVNALRQCLGTADPAK